ncbi:hypothetical protein BC628DRAFT_1428616 [Trametes gibbosa]|nr:hypothetical protein BC628DRAFT_1428616 [Trametes gibbosa]
MRDALAGMVDFSSGEMPALQGLTDVTLEDVLSGAGLLEVVMGVEDEDERPSPPSAMGNAGFDIGQEDLEDLSHPIATAEEISQANFGSTAVSSDVFPYPNSGMMRTDFLFSSPTIRFSRAQKEAVLAWAKEMGAKEVPSLYGLEKFQADALESIGDPTEKVQASSGNVFYMNSIYEALARDYAHEGKRRQMHLYPEFSGSQVREAWQASKWLVEVLDSVLTPMTRVGGKDFYVNELVYCAHQCWFIPTRFFEFEGALWAKGWDVTESKDGLVVADKMGAMPCAMFQLPWPEIQAHAESERIFAPQSAHFEKAMPHPDRLLAQGLEVECPPLIIFIDDVSGNSSKQWNVHYSCYVSNAALPRAELEKDGNIRFVATSPYASPMEIMHAICNDLRKNATRPFKVWDAMKGRYVLIRPWILCLPGDNPMQAELCSHIGLHGNHFCRMCHVGGDQAFKSSNEGFSSLMVPGNARTVAETREAVTSQLVIATHAAGEKPLKNAITSSGVKDSFAMPVLNQLIAKGKLLRRATTTRNALSPEMVNKELYMELMKMVDSEIPLRSPLLDIEGLDVHCDTPVEPLHTHLLGVVKYFWAQTVWVLDKQGRFSDFQARLNSLSRIGLKIPNIMADYMCRYRGALIGKHFKTISQVMVFAVCGLVAQSLQDAWLCIGRLTVLIWETNITDIKVYTKELREVIQETIDFAAALSPGLLTEKNKFHILAHLPDNIERFGPALLFSTERYESFNHVFRLCSIHSNRQAPSRDIAKTFANQDRCRHIASGGFWQDKASGSWVCAGNGVLRHISEHPINARLLGLAPEKPTTPGDITLLPLPPRQLNQPPPRHPVVTWSGTDCSRIVPPLEPKPGEWHRAASFITQSGDQASVGDEVFVHCPTSMGSYSVSAIVAPTGTGQAQVILEILSSTSPTLYSSWIIVRESTVQPEKHAQLKMPKICRDGPVRVVSPMAVEFAVNVQHDCIAGGCTVSGSQRLRQEREDSTRTRVVVEHRDTTNYILNLVALHNQARLRAALPTHLTARTASFQDRLALHKCAAKSLRDTKLQKKLAREAQVRKSAEAALQASITNGILVDALGLSDNNPGGSGLDGLPGAGAEGAPAIITPSDGLASQCTTTPGPSLTDSITVSPNPIAVPRGPQQRRGVPASGGQAMMTGGLGSRVSASEVEQAENVLSGHDGLGGNSLSEETTNPPPSKRRRPSCGSTPASENGLFNVAVSPSGREELMDLDESDAAGSMRLSAMMSQARERDSLPLGSHSRAKFQQDARAKARKYALSSAQSEELMAFCEATPVEMLIDLKIHAMRTDNDIIQRFIRMFVRHPDFLIRLRHNVAAALLAPNIPAYVEGVTVQLTKYFEDHAEHLLGIPSANKNDPADWALVKSAIAVELTNMRSNMKLKIDSSIKNRQDIYELTSLLMMYDMRPKKEHWGRFAFLRQCTIVYDQTPAKKRGDYWKHIDQCLLDVRKDAREQYPRAEDTMARKRHETLFLAHLLDTDTRNFALKSGALSRAVYTNEALTDLQFAAERLVSGFVANDSTVSTESGEESAQESSGGDPSAAT